MNESAIVLALKKALFIRVTCGDRWLVWDDIYNEWVVYERSYGQRKTRTIISTESQEDAVALLIVD